MGCVESSISQRVLLMTSTMSAKINVEAPQVDMSTTVARAMPVSVTGSISTAISGAVTTSMTGVSAAPVAGTTGVPSAAFMMAGTVTGSVSTVTTGAVSIPVTGRATGVTVGVTCLHAGRSEHGKAGSDGQEDNEFFHIELSFNSDSWPQKSGNNIRRGAHQSIQPTSIVFTFDS